MENVKYRNITKKKKTTTLLSSDKYCGFWCNYLKSVTLCMCAFIYFIFGMVRVLSMPVRILFKMTMTAT